MDRYDSKHFDELEKQKKYSEMFEYVSQYADTDDARALNALSYCYYYGYGTEKDYSRCFEYDTAAVETGDADALAVLGFDYEKGIGVDSDMDKAVQLYYRSAERGSAKGQYYLATCYEYGDGVEQSTDTAVGWYRAAAEQDHIKSCKWLAEYYAKKGASIEAACWWYIAASAETDSLKKAEYYKNAGNLYSNDEKYDEYAESSYSAALKLYEQASAEGNYDADYWIGYFYYEPLGVKADYERAFASFSNSARRTGDPRSKYHVALCYLGGIGVAQNKRKALSLFKKAAAEGHVLSTVMLAYCYLEGIGVQRSTFMAEFYIEQLENSGHDFAVECAQLYRGIALYHGLGVKKDIKKAEEHFEKGGTVGRVLYAPICRGDIARASMLGVIYGDAKASMGFLLFKNQKRAIELLEMSLDSDNVTEVAVSNLELLYRRTRRHKKAFELLSSAPSDIVSSARLQRRLGQYYYYGCRVRRDYEKALTCFEKAAALGDDVSRTYAALCHANGRGTVKDYGEARRMLDFDGRFCNLSRGTLIYAGRWGYERDREKGTRLVEQEGYWHEILSSPRGDAYADFFLEGIEFILHRSFDHRAAMAKYLIPMFFKLTWLYIFRNPESTNLSRGEIVQLLLDQRRQYASEHGETTELLKHIGVNTDIIPELREGQREILDSLKNLVGYVTEQKNALPDPNSYKYFTEEQLERIRSDFINETAQKIIDTVRTDAPTVDSERAALEGMFGDSWQRLDGYTKKALVSARVFFASCNRSAYTGLDYSGIVVSATSALENELKLRFFSGFQRYLEGSLGAPDGGWPSSMLFYNNEGKAVKNNRFTLGSLPYIINCSSEDRLKLDAYLSTLRDGLSADVLLKKGPDGMSFVDRCEHIRKSYRNAAAHTEPVPRSVAQECCDDIIGAEAASRKIGEVQGVLLELVRLTDA